MGFKAGAGTGCQRRSQNSQICAVAMLSVQPTRLLSQAHRPPPAATQSSPWGCSWGWFPGPGLQPSITPAPRGPGGSSSACVTFRSGQSIGHPSPRWSCRLQGDRSHPRCPPCLCQGALAVRGDRRDEQRPALRGSCTLCWDTRPLQGAATHPEILSACGEVGCLALHPRVRDSTLLQARVPLLIAGAPLGLAQVPSGLACPRWEVIMVSPTPEPATPWGRLQ